MARALVVEPKFFEEYINPRVANGIEDYLTMGLLPDVQGIYRDDLMKMAQRHVLEPDIDAVLLTAELYLSRPIPFFFIFFVVPQVYLSSVE